MNLLRDAHLENAGYRACQASGSVSLQTGYGVEPCSLMCRLESEKQAHDRRRA